MRLNHLYCALLCGLLALPVWASAQQQNKNKQDLPPGAVFRYETEDGQTRISSSVSDEAIEQGYEVLNSKGRVIRTVEPALTEQERRELQQEKERERQKKRQKKRDEELLQLYAGPGDARRARDRQIEALEVNISYTKNSLEGIKKKLEREVGNAAEYERRGEEVPASVQESIDHYESRIEEHKKEIEQYRKDIEDVRKEYQPIIERLKVIAPEDDAGSATTESVESSSEAAEEPADPPGSD